MSLPAPVRACHLFHPVRAKRDATDGAGLGVPFAPVVAVAGMTAEPLFFVAGQEALSALVAGSLVPVLSHVGA